jgi:hypothetical protein
MTARFPPNPQIERGFAQLFPSSPLQSPPGGRELGRMAALASFPLTTAALEPGQGPGPAANLSAGWGAKGLPDEI